MITVDGLDYHDAGTRRLPPFTRRQFVVWDATGPVDRFDVFRANPAEPWCAWCGDTLRSAVKERRRAFAAALTKEA